MNKLLLPIIAITAATSCHAFWDLGTTTVARWVPHTTIGGRTSRYEWTFAVYTDDWWWWLFFWQWWHDWELTRRQRAGDTMCGITIENININSGVILNRRTVITSANPLEPYLMRQAELHVWCLGRGGELNQPYRYRVWRVRRAVPRSHNMEHWHGQRGRHSPRHDVALITTWDQIYFLSTMSWQWRYGAKAMLTGKWESLPTDLLVIGPNFQTLEHIKNNYFFNHRRLSTRELINCEYIIPKWWGKFICMIDPHPSSGTPSGGALMSPHRKVFGIGCFHLTRGNEKYHIFTDLRYYVDRLHLIANYVPGEYYEYAYPEYTVHRGLIWDTAKPYRPVWQIDGIKNPMG